MLTTLRRISKSGVIGFWRNFTVSLSAIVIIAISLMAFVSIYLVSEMLGATLSQVEQKVDVNVYFETTASSSVILELKTELESQSEVATVEYVTREQALENFKIKNADQEFALKSLEILEDNPLGASFNITANSIDQYDEINEYLKTVQINEKYAGIIDEVNYSYVKQAIDKINAIIYWTQQIGIVVAIALAVLSIIIVYNTIRLTIYTVRNEVAVMRLVGASKFFARGPFIVEGILYGISGTIAALLIILPILFYIAPTLQEIFILNIYDLFINQIVVIVSVMLLIGVALGLISSLFAIRRYLKI